MTPEDEAGDEQPRSPESHPGDGDVSPGLEKLNELDYDERIAVLSTRLENLRNRRDEILKKGIDPARFDQYVKMCEARLEEVKRTIAVWEKAHEQLLHAAADAADATRDVVDKLEELVNQAMKERPFDPQVEEWKELLEELREQYPKID